MLHLGHNRDPERESDVPVVLFITAAVAAVRHCSIKSSRRTNGPTTKQKTTIEHGFALHSIAVLD
jgi:hypothetical protein